MRGVFDPLAIICRRRENRNPCWRSPPPCSHRRATALAWQHKAHVQYGILGQTRVACIIEVNFRQEEAKQKRSMIEAKTKHKGLEQSKQSLSSRPNCAPFRIRFLALLNGPYFYFIVRATHLHSTFSRNALCGTHRVQLQGPYHLSYCALQTAQLKKPSNEPRRWFI